MFLIVSNPTSFPFNSASEYISIKYSTPSNLSLTLSTSSFFLCEKITAEALERFTKLSNSFSGNSLSIGTAIPTPHKRAIYDTYHSYVVSLIITTLLSLNPKYSIRPVPNPITSSLNFP